ncbi:DNA-binding LacI/PurR family transcriptional regulator [Rhizomicrobium palustre]|uniref:DNA-binding LacI/PurR family transcriptional regulator n=1 Tax=Rhizomicrobium palustre TaxID=189966 RepID=A0A846MV21_9PROT|nr:substrate-binding domain-containing protein [Rhizomicrobium palustre]NIK87203.1 DNA-binding LacI/PurR family transcriptional regulator [Rhizomicrobium palustre]
MRTTKRRETEKDSSEPRLDDIIDRKHGLSRLNATIDWRLLEGRLGGGAATASPQGRPSQSRLFIGLALLRDLYELTDDALLTRWIENPYFQLICGESRFQHALPAERSVLTAALRRLTAEKLKTLLRAGLGNAASFDLAMLPELERLGILRKAASAAPVKRRDGDKPVSIYDVAKRAGVSIKTVSLVINRQPNVSLATRTAVLAAIEALAYKPNVFARGLASERSYLIGLLHDVAPGSYIADLQLGALARCRDEGYHLVVELLNPLQDHDVAQRVRSLVSESVLHGVILTPPLCDDVTIMEELAAARTPFVRVAPGNRIPGTTYVNIDEYKAAYEMTAYLIGLGHRRIGFVKGKPDHGAARLRFDGYRKALTDGGLSVTEEYCAQGYFTYQSGLEAGEKLLALKNRPTAIFAGNDDMAAGVLSASYRFNLAVPTDLSIAGFDDSIVAQVVWPRLTTCRQPIKDMAAAAVSILAQRRDKPLERQLAHEVVVRESTAPPPG